MSESQAIALPSYRQSQLNSTFQTSNQIYAVVPKEECLVRFAISKDIRDSSEFFQVVQRSRHAIDRIFAPQEAGVCDCWYFC